MPLGLAKDSMLNLEEMALEKEDKEDSSGGDLNAVTLEDGVGVVPVEASDDSINDMGDLDQEHEEGGGERQHVDDIGSTTSSNDDVSASASAASPTPAGAASSSSSLENSNTNNNSSGSNDAGHTKASETAAASSTHGQYTGFSSGYEGYAYADYGYAATADGLHNAPNLLGGNHQANNFWCCIFPWMIQSGDAMEEVPLGITGSLTTQQATPKDWQQESSSSSKENIPTQKATTTTTTTPTKLEDDPITSSVRSLQDDELSTGSDVFGEKLSEKEKQAVLARLRLAQPDHHQGSPANAADAASEAEEQLKQQFASSGLANGGGKSGSAAPKGILRKTSAASTAAMLQGQTTAANGKKRRSLFPQYAVEAAKKEEKKNLKVSFASMARVVAVKSKKDMDEKEKGDVWWQKSDYEEFRKTGRMITKAMLDGGSEIWLASSASWRLPDQNKASTLKHAMALAERQKNGTKSERSRKAKEDYEAARDKWWHAFGHSRRGLEHVASIDEGRQRQNNVRAAIRSVVEEQRKQKVFHREDADKLRMTSLQHTSWARDLALASGASDADAVRANFDDSNRKSREFYLLKFSRSNSNSETSNEATRSNMPAFMKPIFSIPAAGNRLDANTISQIRYRKTQQQQQQKQKRASMTSIPTKTTAPPPPPPPAEAPIKDDASTGGSTGGDSTSMAKRAAGYTPGQDAANMSAVLTGMGPIPKNAATVGGP